MASMLGGATINTTSVDTRNAGISGVYAASGATIKRRMQTSLAQEEAWY